MGESAFQLVPVLAFAVDIKWEHITGAAVGIAGAGAILGTAWFYAKKKWNALKDAEQQEIDKVSQQKIQQQPPKLTGEAAIKEEAELRETLLNRYREMYELEKERANRELQQFKESLEELHQKYESLSGRYDELKEDHQKMRQEYDRIVQLNVKYQEDKRKDTHEIKNLTQQLQNLTDQLRTMRRQIRDDRKANGLPIGPEFDDLDLENGQPIG